MLWIEEVEKDCWINTVDPTDPERRRLIEEVGVKKHFITNSLDPGERPHIDKENEQLLVILDVPLKTNESRQEYTTRPLGIVLLDNTVVTICKHAFSALEPFKRGEVKDFSPSKKGKFLLLIALRIAQQYLSYLKDLTKWREEIERELRKSMKNEELYALLDLEESLVYFTTSLKANEGVLEKLTKLEGFSTIAEERELMEDARIEMNQALSMANIYSNILSGMMDAFASVISNNLNIVMKFLASIAIVIAIPTIVASFFGMNVALPFQSHPHAFLIILLLSVFLAGSVAGLLAIWKMF
ncbi:MAG: magnesium transporter CorA family protein [Candidatus Korarchaeota archaeon]|nr:magnesium transporter CorA family protein [Candidatus Korarchaeota archaeon]NIU84351.1 magnesium transporter CorA family protein [Candidatus Thorarchaeota archaeon]NIW14468.1 magnesium transporter CorA family protein [Candidatus Thorarchaeota archaeon]NIW52545.1 magnesium transporter CorA family protein [Candidatus Korarchaeota archaeon]